jgi:hypothetical protein
LSQQLNGKQIVDRQKPPYQFLSRIEAVTGMAVTEKVWNEAHQYHRNVAMLQAQHAPGSGIIKGLSIEPDDPPSTVVWLQPGVAIDPRGQLIIVPEKRRCEIYLDRRASQLTLYLLADESSAANGATRRSLDTIHYVTECYRVEQSSGELPEAAVELARIRYGTHTQEIVAVSNVDTPQLGEIDLRYRPVVHTTDARPLTIGLRTQATTPELHLQGWFNLTREIRNTAKYNLWVERFRRLTTATLAQCMLLVLSGHNQYDLTNQEEEVLRAYLERGGVVFVENCRVARNTNAVAVDNKLRTVLALSQQQLVTLNSTHELLQVPHYFAQLPAGAVTRGQPTVEMFTGIGKGVVLLSTYDYACLWGGQRWDEVAQRSIIRDAMEWGNNLLAYAIKHQASVSGGVCGG